MGKTMRELFKRLYEADRVVCDTIITVLMVTIGTVILVGHFVSFITFWWR